MTDQPSPHASDDPHDLEDLDPEQFVGEAPVGDASPGEFMSNDQSSPGTTDASESDSDSDTEEDA